MSGHISAIYFAQESLRLSIPFIAYSLLHAAENILSVIPVEVVAGPSHTPRGLNELDRCWALLLTVQTPDSKHATCLVPVQLNMKGGAAIRLIYTEHKDVQPWDMPISLLSASTTCLLYALAIPNYTDIHNPFSRPTGRRSNAKDSITKRENQKASNRQCSYLKHSYGCVSLANQT